VIVLVIVRRAQCEICSGIFDLEIGEKPPDGCRVCGSTDWLYGPESSDSKYIRQGIKHVKKVLNPGAKSRARQERGRKQWRQFKPKPE
jgi:predicted  nucleic acid-binding Zn-ribbon protein